MKHWIGLLVLGFGAGAFYGIVQQRRKERLERRKHRTEKSLSEEN